MLAIFTSNKGSFRWQQIGQVALASDCPPHATRAPSMLLSTDDLSEGSTVVSSGYTRRLCVCPGIACSPLHPTVQVLPVIDAKRDTMANDCQEDGLWISSKPR